MVGLSLLSALLICALAAQGALAAAHTSENTTAYTCVEVAKGGEFKDAHCDTTETGGKFAHKEIAPGTSTDIEVTNEGTLNETKEEEPATLKGVVLKVESHIICKKVRTDPEVTSFVTNVEGAGKTHSVEGTVAINYSGCEVVKPLNCKVKEPITVKSLVMGVDQLGPEKNTMGLEFTEDPEGSGFASITYEGEKCALKGNTFKVTGSAIGTPGNTAGGPLPSARETGATVKFENANEMESLKLGPEPATFISTATVRMAEKGNPITLTTPT